MKILRDWHFTSDKTESQEMYLPKIGKELGRRHRSLPKFMLHSTTAHS